MRNIPIHSTKYSNPQIEGLVDFILGEENKDYPRISQRMFNIGEFMMYISDEKELKSTILKVQEFVSLIIKAFFFTEILFKE